MATEVLVSEGLRHWTVNPVPWIETEAACAFINGIPPLRSHFTANSAAHSHRGTCGADKKRHRAGRDAALQHRTIHFVSNVRLLLWDWRKRLAPRQDRLAEDIGCHPKTDSYSWSCRYFTPRCGNIYDECEKMICDCDVQLSKCLKKAVYQRKYSFWPNFLCGRYRPSCSNF
ncbi:uncharacterized protein LOC103190668 isoform X1 [Callorhinchus milii]|uniref:uncharacterized protein LOC103190668 isoform X1 n=1 Tax=Callorhinchus milii TaxID=7868 RepID=UPI001C3F9B73|nr:uncharacterized protein LOC103190668 isoform X1 [Callorhinchus milii]